MSRKKDEVQMKRYLALLSFLLFSILVFAQGNYQDVVYLKSGSIIQGVIVEQVPNQYIKIDTTDKDVSVYQMDEIEKLTKEAYQDRDDSSPNSKSTQSGYKGIVEFGYHIGVGDNGIDRYGLNVINGYQINPYISLGFGIGLRNYSPNWKVVPLFADFRMRFDDDNNVASYLCLGIGYSLNAANFKRFRGVGFFFNPTMGVSFRLSNRSAINVGLGYEMQKMTFSHTESYMSFPIVGGGYNPVYSYKTYKFTANSGAISIVAGISF